MLGQGLWYVWSVWTHVSTERDGRSAKERTRRQPECVLVISCCVTNDPKAWWLRSTHMYYPPVSVGQKSWHSQLGALLWVSPAAAMGMPARADVSSPASTRKEALSSSFLSHGLLN